MAINRKFTRIPKVTDLLAAGVPTEVIPTYCALADYSNNKTGLCWPKMETLAATLNRSVRTIQRHLHLLKELDLIEFVERRRNKGRFSSYLYRVLHIARTTGHGSRARERTPNKRRTKHTTNIPQTPQKEAFNWFFGKERNIEAEAEHERQRRKQRKQESRRRTEGYKWLFGD